MKTLYLDCSMGAAGDMLTAALLELLPDPAAFVDRLNSLGLPGVVFDPRPDKKCGICGTHMNVRVNGEEEGSPAHDHGHEHSHTGMSEIRAIVRSLPVSDRVKVDILSVYGAIAAAESLVHGEDVDQIHFHEVGSLDAIADVTAVCLLMEELAPERVVVSPIHVGSGSVRCAHGILPVPAPATLQLLKGVPIYGGEIRGELCTPTGAALLTRFATSYGPMPAMCAERIGYGTGKKDFSAANCVRAIYGE